MSAMKVDDLAKLDPAKVHPDVAARIRSYNRVKDNGGSERAVNAHGKALLDAARLLGTDEPEGPVRPVLPRPSSSAKKRAAKKAPAKKTAAKKTASSGS